MLKKCIYYENTHKYRHLNMILVILFSIGLICGVSAIVIYHVIKPIDILAIYQPKGEEFLSALICFIFLVYFAVLAYRSKYYVQSICINESEVRLVILNSERVFSKSDLTSFWVRRKYLLYAEYILNFKDMSDIIIVSQKKRKISHILKKIIKHNME
ncbi:MAG: hypothetical protein J7L15_03710 [Clostridiales bacterium]|nr:hypothetical protein [Clostridiales bacterium]